MDYIRTDLAVEANQQHSKNEDIPGVKVSKRKEKFDILITNVSIENKQGEEAIGKSIGTYITIDSKAIKNRYAKGEEHVIKVLANEIKELMNNKEKTGVLVVGLGNRGITPDSLGPSVCDKTYISRHMKMFAPEQMDERINEVSAIAPGVLGITGLETGEVIKGIIDRIKPGIVIAIDSLASRKLERISTTFQLTDSGISPGSGIGNKRKALNEAELGVPVIAIGVPLVVYAATIAGDLIEETVKNDSIENEESIKKVFKKIIEGIMNVDGAEMVVTPKEIDIIVEDCARVIASAINIAVNDGLSLDDVNKLMH